jgi:hypothetical protein
MHSEKSEYVKKEVESFKKDLEKQFEFLVKNQDLIKSIAKRMDEVVSKENEEEPYPYKWDKMFVKIHPSYLLFKIDTDGELIIDAALENTDDKGELEENLYSCFDAKYLYDDSELTERESKIKEPNPEDIKNAKIKNIKDQIKFYEDKLKEIEEGN